MGKLVPKRGVDCRFAVDDHIHPDLGLQHRRDRGNRDRQVLQAQALRKTLHPDELSGNIGMSTRNQDK